MLYFSSLTSLIFELRFLDYFHNALIDTLMFKSIFLFIGGLGRASEACSPSVSKQRFCGGKIHVDMIKWKQPGPGLPSGYSEL